MNQSLYNRRRRRAREMMAYMNTVVLLCLAAIIALSSSLQHARRFGRSSVYRVRRRTTSMLGGDGSGITGDGAGNSSALSILWGKAAGPKWGVQDATGPSDAEETISKGFIPSGPTDLANVDKVALPPRTREYVHLIAGAICCCWPLSLVSPGAFPFLSISSLGEEVLAGTPIGDPYPTSLISLPSL